MSGNFTDQLRKRLDDKKESESSKDKLADKFNKATMQLLDKFMNEINSGSIQIDDTADLMRLYQIYTEVNDLQNMTGEGSGRLPQLSPRQSRKMKSHLLTEEVEKPDGEEEFIIDPESLAGMSAKDIEDMVKEREIDMNEDNAQEWEDNLFG